MKLQLRLLVSRLRATATLSLLRLTGLALAALLAAAVPTFVTTAMERVLSQQMQAQPDATAVTVSWRAPDDVDHGADVARLDAYLRRDFVAAAGFHAADAAVLQATAQRPVQRLNADGSLDAAKRYLRLAALPTAGLTVATGRAPAPGQPEVALPQAIAARYGLQVGDRLRFPLTADGRGQALTLTVVGVVTPPGAPPWDQVAGPLETTLLTSSDYLASTKLPIGQVDWALALPKPQLHAAGVAALVAALDRLPTQVAQFLPEAEVVTTPRTWLTSFLAQMRTTQGFLLVLLTPVFLLVAGFAFATAGVVVTSRRTELAVLRSRGATPLRILGGYLPESLLLAGAGTLLGLLLTPPTVRLMGLTAGFLQLVGRPPLPIKLTLETLLYAGAAAVLVEAVALIPLVRATRLTVATMRDEAVTRSPLLGALRLMLELALLGVLAYGTWKLRTAGPAGDALFLALPALALAAAGALALRLLEVLLTIADRLLRRTRAGRAASPPLYLTVSLLAADPGRYRSLWLMLVITAGLGIYGAAFARTLDRDLVMTTRYRLGADVVLHTAWETEVLAYNADGEPTSIAYHEPPFEAFQQLPGVTGTAKVQTRKNVSLLLGSRNLGKVLLLGIDPQTFGQTARFSGELTPVSPARYLNALAADERSVVISSGLAGRLGLKPGDQLTVKTATGQSSVTVAGVVPYWPGLLPDDGDFVVGNLPYLQDSLGLAPYDIWLRLAADGSTTAVVDVLSAHHAALTGLEDARAAVAGGRREPFRLGIYGTLSAGFVVALVVMALTYLMGIGLALQRRAKELGVLRAMGMPRQQVALSLYLEQLILILTALAAGLPAGAEAAAVYVPILRLQAGSVPLPLQVSTVQADRVFVLIGSALALLLGMLTVAAWLRRLTIGAALRLGEDA